MEYELKNKVIVTADGLYISCEWNHPVYGWIPFTAYRDDTEKHGREIWLQLSTDPETLPYTPPSTEQLAQEERAWRDGELSWFDSVCYRNQFYWDSLTTEQRQERSKFRSDLLAYPDQPGFPTDLSLRPVRPLVEG